MCNNQLAVVLNNNSFTHAGVNLLTVLARGRCRYRCRGGQLFHFSSPNLRPGLGFGIATLRRRPRSVPCNPRSRESFKCFSVRGGITSALVLAPSQSPARYRSRQVFCFSRAEFSQHLLQEEVLLFGCRASEAVLIGCYREESECNKSAMAAVDQCCTLRR